MVQKQIRFNNSEGFKPKAAAAFVQEAGQYQSQIQIMQGSKMVNAKSLMGVLSLGVRKDDRLLLIARGSDEAQAVAALAELLEKEQ